MAAKTVHPAFATVGTDVVVITSLDGMFPAKVVKATKTQITVEFRRRGATVTQRFIPSRWSDRYATQMDEFGTRDSYGHGDTLLLATDPSLPGRRAARAKRRAELALKAAATAISSRTSPTLAQLDAAAAAIAEYRALIAPAAD